MTYVINMICGIAKATSAGNTTYATDGMKSPAPVLPGRDSVSPDLGEVRRRESEAAMAVLGVPRDNLCFFGLPEAKLSRHYEDLRRRMLEHLERIQPDHVLVPFRFDRHLDHLAVNQAATVEFLQGRLRGRLAEYFVYHRWRLLPRRDIRRYLRPDQLLQVDLAGVSALKRAALDCFQTQTTQYYPWQTRPILTPQLLDEECRGAEYFLRYDRAYPGSRVFTAAASWIRIAHRLEPKLQKWKYVLNTAFQRATGGGH
ncbi:MAG: PIG-L family deacetylase [Lysobacterales bacterium]|nr:MAG: PIG-L family deacetylase [Xanthomonadales bacterium]